MGRDRTSSVNSATNLRMAQQDDGRCVRIWSFTIPNTAGDPTSVTDLAQHLRFEASSCERTNFCCARLTTCGTRKRRGVVWTRPQCAPWVARTPAKLSVNASISRLETFWTLLVRVSCTRTVQHEANTITRLVRAATLVSCYTSPVSRTRIVINRAPISLRFRASRRTHIRAYDVELPPPSRPPLARNRPCTGCISKSKPSLRQAKDNKDRCSI